MDIYTIEEVLLPLSTAYVGDDDLAFISKRDVCEGGFFLYKENYLLSAADARINNYSSLYLTSNKFADNILKLNAPAATSTNIDTVLFTIPGTNKHLYLPDVTDNNITPIFSENVSDSNSIFEIEYQSDTVARIACQRGNKRYYLHYKDGKFFFLYPSSAYMYTTFNYLLSDDKLFLFRVTPTEQTVVSCKDGVLSMLPYSQFKSNYIQISPFAQQLDPKLNTSWVSYDTSNINALKISNGRNCVNLTNNFLISNQYSYLTGNSLPVNLLTLKNQYTHTERSHRVNDIEQFEKNIPSVNKRDYTKLVTGVEQEKGNYNIIIPYEFYSTDYKFVADAYTTFKLPGSLYPFSKINVNDAQFKLAGSIGGDTPYTSDKIFYRDIHSSERDGQYLCTWLSAGSPNSESVWVDRYFYPDRSSHFNALTGRTFHSYAGAVGELITAPLPVSSYYDSFYLYESLSAENNDTPRSIKSSLQGQSFFDKKSDLTFLPNEEYIYQRIGDNFVQSVVDALSSRLIQENVTAYTAKGVPVSMQGEELVLNNNAYGLAESYRNINNTSQATVSIWLDMDDWQTSPGHQIVGSFNDRGFSMVCDPIVTPFIKLQDNKRVITFNSDFEIVDASYHNSPGLDTVIVSVTAEDYAFTTITYYATAYQVKDIFRTDHLDTFQPVVTYYTLSSINIKSIYDNEDHKVTPDDRCPLILIDSVQSEPQFLLADNKLSYGTPLTGLVVEPCKLK